MKRIQAKPGAVIWLGHCGEENARQVEFDFSLWQEQYGEGTLELVVQRPGEGLTYPAVLAIEGSTAIWTVTDADTAIPGSTGRAELRYIFGDGEVKSDIWRTEVTESMDEPEDTPPEPYQDWVDQVLTASVAAVEAANNVGETIAEELTAAKESGEFDGKDGVGVASIKRIAGTSAPGTTDTYAITLSDGSVYLFTVYNGADGDGAGDMRKSVYDSQNKNTDVFQYIDDLLKNYTPNSTGDCLPLSGGVLTGALTLHGDPTEDLHAVPKQYVDDTLGYVETELAAVNAGSSDSDSSSESSTSGVAYEIGHGLKVESNTLLVNSVTDFNGDNSLPATASLVQTAVGNIEVLLATI